MQGADSKSREKALKAELTLEPPPTEGEPNLVG